MYELVPQGDPDGISIDEELLKNMLDKQASSDQKTRQILFQTKTAISYRNRPREGEHHTPDAITTGAVLVLLLVTGSPTSQLISSILVKDVTPTALPMDYAAERTDRGPRTRAAQNWGCGSLGSDIPPEVSIYSEPGWDTFGSNLRLEKSN